MSNSLISVSFFYDALRRAHHQKIDAKRSKEYWQESLKADHSDRIANNQMEFNHVAIN